MKVWPRLCLVLVSAALALGAAGLMFSTFKDYDDEGYMHYTLNAYAAHGGLYERIDSQYGPFFHLVHHGLQLLGVPFTTNGGRALMLVYWLATVGFSGATAWQLTRSLAATAFTLGATFLHLKCYIHEPLHPGGFAATLLALLAWIGTRHPSRPALLAGWAGAIGGALLLTKINLGIFVLAGAGAWWLVHLPGPAGWRRAPALLPGTLLALLPFVLMHNHLATGWAAVYALVASLAAISVVAIAARHATPIASWRHLGPLVLAATAVAVVSVASVWAHGTSLLGIFRGVVLDPLRHPELFAGPMPWEPGEAWVMAFAVAATAAAVGALAHDSPATRRLVVFGRLVMIGIFAFVWIAPDLAGTNTLVMGYGLVLAWLFILPLGAAAASPSARAWVALLLVVQALQAYPVAGSQLGWGTFLWIPLAVAGAHEAFHAFCASQSPRLAALGSAAVLVFTLAGTLHAARYGRNLLKYGDPLDLPGATWVRLPARQASSLRLLAHNARAHAAVLFSHPGLLSFNHWSAVPPPTLHNNTHWFTLVPPVEQEEIRRRLAASPHSAVIFNRTELGRLRGGGIALDPPLAQWLAEAYVPLFRIDDYEFGVPRGRRVAPVAAASARAAPGCHMITALVRLPERRSLAAVELHRFKGIKTERLVRWPVADPRDAAPIARPPDSPAGFSHVEFSALGFPTDLAPADGILYFLDGAGHRLAEARLL